MEITGKIIAVLEERSGVSARNGNSWRCGQYVLETTEQYPKKFLFEVFGEDKIQSMDIKTGEVLTVSFSIDAHEYNGKWFNQIRAWKVDRQSAIQTDMSNKQKSNDPIFPPMPETDELPFGTGDMEEPPF
jgi:hypothetical protein